MADLYTGPNPHLSLLSALMLLVRIGVSNRAETVPLQRAEFVPEQP